MEYFAEECRLTCRGVQIPGGSGLLQGRCARGISLTLQRPPDVHYGDTQHWVCAIGACQSGGYRAQTPGGRRVLVRGATLGFRDGKSFGRTLNWKIVEEVVGRGTGPRAPQRAALERYVMLKKVTEEI